MKYFKSSMIFAALLFILSSCKYDKVPYSPETPVNTTAGKGGVYSVRLIPKHHIKYIYSCTAYIKYNTQNRPTNGFDDSAVCTLSTVDNYYSAYFNNLKPGSYYVYGFGYDSSIGQNVKGGLPIFLPLSSQTGDTGTQILAVTE